MATIACVVEGHAEVEALPVLIRRIAELGHRPSISVRRPHRLDRGRFESGDHLERTVRTQSAATRSGGGVLVLCDSDDDDPSALERRLRDRLRDADVGPVAVVAATREYESWFLAGIESLRDHRSVKDDAAYPGDPEVVRDAKGALRDVMLEPYRQTIHQSAFSARLDVASALPRSPSLRRLVDAVTSLAGPS